MGYRLMEKTWAKAFEDAYYIGNGRLGGTVYGEVPTQELLINDDTLWSGSEHYVINPNFRNISPRFRSSCLRVT